MGDATKADIVRRPKFYFFDTGVLNGLLGNFTLPADRKGLLFEHMVINQVLASAKARDIAVKLSYFRTRSGFEVDLIVQIERSPFRVEIKSGRADQGQMMDWVGDRVEPLLAITNWIARRKDRPRSVTVISGWICLPQHGLLSWSFMGPAIKGLVEQLAIEFRQVDGGKFLPGDHSRLMPINSVW